MSMQTRHRDAIPPQDAASAHAHAAEPRAGDDAGRRARYHHGDLEAALIAQVRHLVERDGALNFSIAEACKCAGVSTAAPYRHFRDKQAILEAVAKTGFAELADRLDAARAGLPDGSVDAIAATGAAYVAFAADNPNLFKLMFGSHPPVRADEGVHAEGMRSFGVLLAQVAAATGAAGIDDDVLRRALPLWTFVHGVAFLTIDGDYGNVAPDLDVTAMIRETTQRLL